MLDITSDAVELSARAAHTIAAAMRLVAEVDGNHPQEMALIAQFEGGLPEGGEGALDLDALDTPELREAFLRSLLLLALADNEVSDGEGALIRDLARQAGLSDDDVGRVQREIATVMLSMFQGVHVFRDRAVSLGRQLGLDDESIGRILG